MSMCPKCHGSERFCVCVEEEFDSKLEKMSKEFEIYRLRLAGALMASEGASPLVFQEAGVLPQVRDCVTINSILDLYAEMQKYRTECDMLAQEYAQLRKALENKQ